MFSGEVLLPLDPDLLDAHGSPLLFREEAPDHVGLVQIAHIVHLNAIFGYLLQQVIVKEYIMVGLY